jgi:hypothetical protein
VPGLPRPVSAEAVRPDPGLRRSAGSNLFAAIAKLELELPALKGRHHAAEVVPRDLTAIDDERRYAIGAPVGYAVDGSPQQQTAVRLRPRGGCPPDAWRPRPSASCRSACPAAPSGSSSGSPTTWNAYPAGPPSRHSNASIARPAPPGRLRNRNSCFVASRIDQADRLEGHVLEPLQPREPWRPPH